MNEKWRISIKIWIFLCVAGAVFTAYGDDKINDPRDLTGHVLWLDGSDVDGDFKPGGDFIEGTRWRDKSTAHNADAVQENTSNRPTVMADGLNHLSVVRFDGDDIMDVDSAVMVRKMMLVK